MIRQIDAGVDEASQKKQLRKLIRQGTIQYAGYIPGKIYGRLSCSSGKRMKAKNRIFFSNEEEAILAGYRPCGHCLKERYKMWKLTHSK
ncbi:Ada metal-binding domain-containing protein [Danxiaibacter flavus]|uniref:Ada metal-binding domain-containing protein n=1 Tax=Danxiaibacter flavus TaxID=3049108 RepID=A0ABV3Z999_9BACT|nr:Ada metal-binding domain-containing protein [Chitinophagaceae bacterium DXS]